MALAHASNAGASPHVTSYDTSFEHSMAHWMEVRYLVEEAENEPMGTSEPAHSHGILTFA